MAVKVLVNALGQHILADTKQIENKESGDVVGYWVEQPRLVYYNQGEDGEVSVNFGSYCLISAESAFSIRAESVTSILEPREEVVEAWKTAVYGPEEERTVDNGDGTVTEEDLIEKAKPVILNEDNQDWVDDPEEYEPRYVEQPV
jgi:hypothetical protein